MGVGHPTVATTLMDDFIALFLAIIKNRQEALKVFLNHL